MSAISGAIVAIAAVTMLAAYNQNQAQFPPSAAALLVPLPAVGLAIGNAALRLPTRVVLALGIVGLALGILGSVASQVLPNGWRFLAPLLPVCVAIILAFAWAHRPPAGISVRLLRVWAAGLVLAAASVGAGVTVVAHKFAQTLNAPVATESTDLAWNEDDHAAAEWVDANVPNNAIIATNRWCRTPSEGTGDCSPYWWLTSALTNRRVLVEGLYGQPTVPVTPRRNAVVDFVSHPNAQSARALRDLGVEWVWVDKHGLSAGGWEPWATVVYENPGVSILRMNESGDR